MPWDDILKKGKAYEDTHPNTSTPRMWSNYCDKTLDWIHENKKVMDYFKFSQGSGSMDSLIKKLVTEFMLGENKPERRLNYIREISRLMFIMGNSRVYDREVTMSIWPLYVRWVNEANPSKAPTGNIWNMNKIEKRFFRGEDIPDNLFDLWMRTSMLLFMEHIDEITDAMGPHRAGQYLGSIGAGHTSGTRSPAARKAIILNIIRVFPRQIKNGPNLPSMRTLYIELVEAMFPGPKWSIEWDDGGMGYKKVKTSKPPGDIWKKIILKRQFVHQPKISSRMWDKWYDATELFLHNKGRASHKDRVAIGKIHIAGVRDELERLPGIVSVIDMIHADDRKDYKELIITLFKWGHASPSSVHAKYIDEETKKPIEDPSPDSIWRKAILKRIQGLPSASVELQSHWYHITRLWLQSPMGQRIDDFDFGDEDWRTDQPRAALEYITHNHKRLRGDEQETDRMIRAAMRNLTINGDRRPYTRFLMENLPYYDYELGHLDMRDPNIMDRAAEYNEDNSPSIWGKVESVRGDD